MSHIHDKIDFTVEVFIVYNNRVLLRKHDKLKKWLSVGGHIELNEDPIEAALREVKEEVGLDIELVENSKIFEESDHSHELLPPMALSRHPISPTHEHVTFVYFAKATTDAIHPTYADDVSEECRWCTKEDLETMDLWPNVKAYALAALERLSI